MSSCYVNEIWYNFINNEFFNRVYCLVYLDREPKGGTIVRQALKLHFDYDSFELSSESAELLASFRTVFSEDTLAPDDPAAEQSCRSIEISETGGVFRIEGESPNLIAPSFEEAAYAVMRIMSDSFVSHVSEEQMVMHAATAAFGSTAVLFSGSSGSGKTSLALAFSEFDGFVGDECAYISVSSASVRHETFPFQIKGCNVDMMSRYGTSVKLDVYEDTVGEASYLPLDALHRCTEKWIPISAVVFPAYGPGNESCSIARISPAELPELILGSLIGPSKPSSALATFLSMCGSHGIRFYKAAYSDASECAETLYEFLKKERQRR